MEVEEQTTSNHLEESTAPETTTIINESLLQNTTTTDKQSENESSNLISESHTQGEDDLSVSVSKSEDLEAFAAVAVGETEEVDVDCRNLESVAALSGGVENSVAVESANALEGTMDRDVDEEGGVKEIDVPSDDVAAVEGGGSELTCSVNVDGGEGDKAVVDRNGDLEVVEEKLENNEADTNVGEFSVIEKDENEDDDKEIVKEEENTDVLKDLKQDVDGDEGDANLQFEDVENVQEMAGSDVRNDDVNVQLENIEDETTIEEPVVAEVVKEEETVAVEEEAVDVKADFKEEASVEKQEIVRGVADEEKTVDVREDFKEEALMANQETVGDVADEEEAADVKEDFKEEALMENEETIDGVADEEDAIDVREDIKEEALMVNEEQLDGVAENDEEETMVVDEEKSVDTEMGTEKSLDTELEAEKSLDTEMETEKDENEDEEEANFADEEKLEEADMESEPESSKKGSGGKRKRGGKISKTTPNRKTIEEDVCFICFDGGDLVLCDRRNCPKAYHPSCVNRDEAFFQTKGRWNCGWHLCSICEKKAEYMCYTCTYSLCKACTKTSVILCVREKEKKGLCEACMKTVMIIENHEDEGNENFDDENSWEHLFKDYWIETKAKHNLSLTELVEAKSTWKDNKDESGFTSDNPPETLKTRKTRRTTKRQKSIAKDDNSITEDSTEWVSKELLEFVTHMRNGDSSIISQFEVQDLLLEYIKRNKLRDPNRKSQIICDARLEGIFGKPRVAHIEMLKLLESHFFMKEDSQVDEIQGSVVDNEVSQVDDKDKKRKGRKKGDKRGVRQLNLEDYAAIDIHNISLIYLRRKLVEDLLDDMESFDEKIVGTFVRIRISGANQKQDIYRLVQVTGTSEAAQYTLGKRTTCTMIEILNLDKKEIIPIDTISNQEFTEDECKRLRQSIKCGLINRLSVGDILDKATELQAARVNDWLETEMVRLSHLRDRASDLGRKKELRECVEKLNKLKTPEERARRLEEFPIIHDDPTMDPEYGSEDDTDLDDKKQESYSRSDSFRYNNKRGRDQFSPRGDYNPSKDTWSGTPRTSNKNYEFTRNLSNKSFSPKFEDRSSTFKMHSENSSSHDRDRDRDRDTFIQPTIVLEKPNFVNDTSPSPKTPVAVEIDPKINESEKMWHYKDPSGKIQGPFSMTQLRKWSNNGYFPVGLKIWRKSDKEDDGIVLSDALEGKFDQKLTSREKSTVGQPQKLSSQRSFGSLPSPTPNKVGSSWTGGQTAGQTGGQTGGSSSYGGVSEGLQSPTPNPGTSMVACVNKDVNTLGSGQPSQLGQVVVPPPENNIMQPQMVQSTPGQTSQGWLTPGQTLQPNPNINMADLSQQLAYSQWGGGSNMVQNPVGSYMPPPPVAAAPQEAWGQQPSMQQPFPVVQPGMQQPPQQPNWVQQQPMAVDPNMGWVASNVGNQMGWVQQPMVQGPQVAGNVNPGWVMQGGWVQQPPVQGGGWVAAPVQNMNPGWVGPPGQVGPNPGWVAPGPNQVPVNPNAGWVNGAPVPVPNQGWVGPPGNQGPPAPPVNQGPPPPPGNTNQNWRNQGSNNWGGNDQQHNRGSYSGQRRNNNNNRGGGSNYRGNRRNFNKQDSFHGGGGSGGDSARSSDQ